MNEKEIVFIFEDQEKIKVNIENNEINYNLDNLLKITNPTITNSDGTLIIKLNDDQTKADINTKVIQRYKTHYEFPNIGIENALYIGLEEKKIWCWIEDKYMLLNDYGEIEIINGGDATNGK